MANILTKRSARQKNGRRGALAALAVTAALVLSAAPAMGSVLGQKLVPSDAIGGDLTGFSVSISGDTAFVGAPRDDGAGSDAGMVYVYERGRSGDWTEHQRLVADPAARGMQFGYSVALEGDLAIVGAYRGTGSAYVFQRGGDGTWAQAAKLTALGTEAFGRSVAISGDRVLVGADLDSNGAQYTGGAYVFEPDGMGGWAQTQKLVAGDREAWDFFGAVVGLSGDRLVVGAFGDDDLGAQAGAAYVFELVGGTWTEVQKLTASDGAASDDFGRAVAIHGDLVAVGAAGQDELASNAGAVFLFQRGGTGTWTEVQKLNPAAPEADGRFGSSVSVDAGRMAVGAVFMDTATENTGMVFSFVPGAGQWVPEESLIATDGVAYEYFGVSVSVSGGDIIAGAHVGRDGAGVSTGNAHIFALGGNRAPIAVIAPIPDAECFDGSATVTLDGSGSYDPDGDAITFAWTAAGIAFDDPTADKPTAMFPLGATEVTLTVTDPHGATGVAKATANVVDTLAPSITITRPMVGAAYANDVEVVHGVVQAPILVVGPLTVVADAADQCGVVHVDFASSSGAAGTDASSPYLFVHTAAPTASGQMTVDATVLDLGGHTAMDSIGFVKVGTTV